MSKVLKATEAQYQELNGYTTGVSMLEFIQDFDDNWVVSADVLEDSAFEEIKPKLIELEEIKYNPKITIE